MCLRNCAIELISGLSLRNSSRDLLDIAVEAEGPGQPQKVIGNTPRIGGERLPQQLDRLLRLPKNEMRSRQPGKFWRDERVLRTDLKDFSM